MEPPIETPQGARGLAQNGKLALIVGVVLILAIAGAAFALSRSNKDRYSASNDKQEETSQNDYSSPSSTNQSTSAFLANYSDRCEKKDTVNFTSFPLKEADFSYFEPLGKMADAHVTPTDHLYLSPTNPNAADNTYPVLMPADGTIVEIGKMPQQQVGDALSGTKTIQDDHRVTISHSCRYFSIFIHVHALSDAVKKEVGALDWNTSKRTNIKLKAGEAIGYIGGSPVDWSVNDTESTLKGFITPSRYQDESWKIHTIDPTDLYTGEMKEKFIARSLRSSEPWGGKIDYDQAGKLVGTWFQTGSGNYFGDQSRTGEPGYRYWDGHLSIVPDYLDSKSTVFSIGNWEGSAQQLTVKGAFGPASIGVGSGPVKIELLRYNHVKADGSAWTNRAGLTRGVKLAQTETFKGTALVQVLDGEKLKVELFPGKTAAQVSGFTSAARTYER